MSESYYVLDGEDRIVRVVGEQKATFGAFAGHSIWEVAPNAEQLFSPYFEQARTTGREIEFKAFYGGVLALRRVIPTGDTLTVMVTPLCELDLRSLATLNESLRAIEVALADRESAQPDRRARVSLQALP